MLRFKLFIVFTFLLTIAYGQKEKADSLYISQHYQEAASLYNELLLTGVNTDVHYNLANCYFRTNNIPAAVLHYERALKLDPSNEDARYNLELCRAKTGTSEVYGEEMFFSTLFRRWALSKSANQWLPWCYILVGTLLLCWLLFSVTNNVARRKIIFVLGLLSFIAVVIVNVFAYKSKQAFLATDRVVVMKATPVYEGPTLQAKSFGELVPGATYRTDIMQGEDWVRICLEDGTVGWCESACLEVI